MNPQLLRYFYECEDYFFRSVSKECTIFNDQAIIYMTGVPVASLNFVVLHKQVHNLNDFFIQCDQFFANQKLPWAAVISTHYLEHSIEDYLQSIEFEASENAIPMFLDLNHISFTPNQSLLIKETDTNLNDWMFPLVEAFHSTQELTTLYQHTHEHALAKKARLRHLTLYIDDKPLSSLTLSFHNNLARIDDFGTLPAYQNKGYGTYLLSYALEKVKGQGAEFCFLEAAESSLSLYEKMGFKSLFKRKYLWDFLIKNNAIKP
ncbi:GNAT family N-acetyltransferase [Legionella brunensis]|uniref:GNAT family acetyltransferase n=1 Tax=Legionella brunensis TaxID=29422 RepID=A0A0W0S3H8_9GAMM|nr:GNAT family N-acetyltransferase [Legionella brunensis]KTC78095.1 GNAT family acetyltransferase [Legionella brunensis]